MLNCSIRRSVATLAACSLAAAMLASPSPAAADTVAYWQFNDQSAGNTAGTVATQVNSPTLNGTATANGSGSKPVYSSDVPAGKLYDGIGGPTIDNPAPGSNTTSLRFTSPDAPFAIAPGYYGGSTNGGSVNVADPNGDFFGIGAGSFTVEGFVKISLNDNFATLVGKGRTGNNSSWEIDTNNNGTLRLRVDSDNSANGTGSHNQGFTTSFNLEDGKWHEFALTYNASTRSVALFGDYQQVGGGTLGNNGVMVYDTSALIIGDYNGGRALDGWLDDIRISNTVLSPTQFITTIPSPAALPAGLALMGLTLVKRRSSRRRG